MGFDRPLRRDPLFLVGVVLAVGAVAWALARSPADLSTSARVFDLAIAPPAALLCAGIIGGVVREYARARQTDRAPTHGHSNGDG